MNRKLYITTILLVLQFLQGCSSLDIIARTAFMSGRTEELKNSEGNIVECTVSKVRAMSNGTNYRDEKIRECVLAYEKQGYKKLAQEN